jgi:hypothetical protein
MSAENLFVVVTVHVLAKHLDELRALINPGATNEEIISDAIISGLVELRWHASLRAEQDKA